ncbi:MAG: hypothetical protein SGILL_002104 [Bacillariaceae sp.]
MESSEESMLMGMLPINETCPCATIERDLQAYYHQEPFLHVLRDLQDNENSTYVPTSAPTEFDYVLWEILYVCGVLLFMLVALISDRIGADSVMMIALTLFMASGIITVEEGVMGFSNEGVLTVMALFVVADGISRTGALDWYMTKLLGRPKTVASAQLRLMIPISFVSAFLNNTPVVAVMIPIVQRWAKNIHMSAQQLLIPLSFASILGGTCTLIGTSTNLIVAGLLKDRYPDDPEIHINLFDLSIYGVPIAVVGIMYILVTSRCLLPGGAGREGGTVPLDMASDEDVLLGAKLMPWSPAAGRSVKRSGLRDTGGIYLVSVHRAATGNVHRAVGQDFVVNVGDVLYFTGLVEGFGEFCEEHGMEVLTNDSLDTIEQERQVAADQEDGGDSADHTISAIEDQEPSSPTPVKNLNSAAAALSAPTSPLRPVLEGSEAQEDADYLPVTDIGVTKESLLQADEAERSRSITRMIDTIRGVARDDPTEEEDQYLHKATPRKERQPTVAGAHKVVVTSEHGYVIVGIDTRDRPGLLLDISKGLLRLNLTLRHSEASVVADRSISIWRCEVIGSELPDLEEIWSVMNVLLESTNQGGTQGLKREGLRVIRAVVTPTSMLIGKTAHEVNFKDQYRAAIVAVQKGANNVLLSGLVFGPGDVLILQTNNDSPLLRQPPPDFYKRGGNESGTVSRSGSVNSFFKKITKSLSGVNLDGTAHMSEEMDAASRPRNPPSSDDEEGGFYIGDDVGSSGNEEDTKQDEEVQIEEFVSSVRESSVMVSDEEMWKDLQVIFPNSERRNEDGAPSREFLTAMEVAPKSQLAGRTAAETGLDKLPGVFLVSIDRPTGEIGQRSHSSSVMRSIRSVTSDGHSTNHEKEDELASLRTIDPIFKTVSPDTPLQDGDVLWFAGGAQSVGDLRKIPGLVSFENEEVEKINEKVHDRRLVEAVIARRGPLVGKTVKEVRFRTKYGAAVIAVHRDGAKVHEHPGRIKLQAGDVLLLEAGPTFIKGSADSDRAFSLLAEVEDSAPPRLRLLIPALVITVAMLAVCVSFTFPFYLHHILVLRSLTLLLSAVTLY